MDRQLKKVAKTDEIGELASNSLEFVTGHTAEVKKYGAIALGVLVLAGGTYLYMNHQASAREEALSQALKVDDATVGANPNPAAMHFETQAEKDQATQKAYAEVASKYRGSQEGAIAAMNVAQVAVDKGDNAQGEKLLKDIVDSAPAAYASQASLTLAQLYDIEGKHAEAEKLLNDLVKNPTATVSKEEALIALAKSKMKTDPDGARKILEPLRTERTAVSKAAMTALGELATSNK